MKMSLRGNVVAVVAAFAALALTAFPTYAGTLNFENITGNNVGDAAIGEAQLSVDVTDAGAGFVSFLFSNAGPEASSITDVYFDDGSLLAIAQIIDADDGIGGDPGVDFSQGASPGNLPGANMASPAFVATTGFVADSDPPTQPKGVNPGEWLEIIYSLQAAQAFTDVEDELADGRLRIGIHVQGFDSGGSESFVNLPPGDGGGGGGGGGIGDPVPEPSTMLLFGSGLVAVALWGRKKFQI